MFNITMKWCEHSENGTVKLNGMKWNKARTVVYVHVNGIIHEARPLLPGPSCTEHSTTNELQSLPCMSVCKLSKISHDRDHHKIKQLHKRWPFYTSSKPFATICSSYRPSSTLKEAFTDPSCIHIKCKSRCHVSRME